MNTVNATTDTPVDEVKLPADISVDLLKEQNAAVEEHGLPPLSEEEQKEARKLFLVKFLLPASRNSQLYAPITIGISDMAGFSVSAKTVLEHIRKVDYEADMAKAEAFLQLIDDAGGKDLDPTPRQVGFLGKRLETLKEIFERIMAFFEKYEAIAQDIKQQQADLREVIGTHTTLLTSLQSHYDNNEKKERFVKQLEWAARTWLLEKGEPELKRRQDAVEEDKKAVELSEGKMQVDSRLATALSAWETYVNNARTYADSKVSLGLHTFQVINSAGMHLRTESMILQKLEILCGETVDSWYDLMYQVYLSVSQILGMKIIKDIDKKTTALRKDAAKWSKKAAETVVEVFSENGFDFDGFRAQTDNIRESLLLFKELSRVTIKIAAEHETAANAMRNEISEAASA